MASKARETNVKVQVEELEALTSIFGDDLRVEKPVWGNISFCIAVRLLGQDSVGSHLHHAQLELAVTYTATYPRTPPSLDVRGVFKEGLPSLNASDLVTIKQLVVSRAAQLAETSAGEPYVFELVRVAQDFLADKAKATRKHTVAVTKVSKVAPQAELSSPNGPSGEVSLSVLEDEARAKKREAWLREQNAQEKVHKESAGESSKTTTSVEPSSDTARHEPHGKKGGRYYTDYEDLGAVGRGGFGHVYKARNRLDGMIYAVKKIKLENDEEQNRKIRSEVKTLARLVHPNIVRYFAAWVEEGDGDNSSDSEEESEFSEYSQSEPSTILRPASSFNQYSLNDEDLGGFTWDRGSGNDDDEDDEAQKSRRTSLASSDRHHHQGDSLKPHMLYIVMEFVPRTVRSLIDSKELIDQDDHCFELLREILEALACVHELHIIHQDIKPENLLIDEHGRIKLGDFGLAVQQEEDRETGEVGTTYYRAPEVGRGNWDERCDIYSVGVVLIEMFTPSAETGMERHKILTSLRLDPPQLPEKLKNEQAARLARQMLQKDPKKRPSALQALQAVPGHVMLEHAVDTVLKGLAFGSNAHKRLLKHLFSQSSTYETDAAFDYDPASDTVIGDDMDPYSKPASSRALSELSAANALPPSESLVPVSVGIAESGLEATSIPVLQTRGAVPFKAPFLMPNREPNKAFSRENRSASLLDPSGFCVSLPYGSLTRPFARFLALNRSIRTIRRYDVGEVFARAGGGGQPRSQRQLCTDFIAPRQDLDRGGSRIAFIEQIETMRECLLNTSRLSLHGTHGITVEIGHAKFLPSLFEACRVPPECQQKLVQTISRYEFFRDWKHAKDVLVDEVHCPVGSVQALRPFLPIGKRIWVSGTLAEILPNAPTFHRTRSASLRDTDPATFSSLIPPPKSIEETSATESSDEGEYIRRRGDRRRTAHHNQGNKPSSASTSAAAMIHPVDAILESATSAKMPQCADLIREMWAIASTLSNHPNAGRVRIVLWTEPPNDVGGLFFRLMIRRRRAVYRGARSGASRLAGVSYEEGHEFVAADGGHFEDLISSYLPSSKLTSDVVAITARLHLDRIVKLRVHATIDDVRRRPLIRLCWPKEKDAAEFDCSERCRVAARLRNDIHLGVEWVHPPGLSAEALLTLCNESGGRLIINKLIAPSGAALNPSTGAVSEPYRVRGWALTSNTPPSEADLHLGVFVDKRCESWSELLKAINQILGVGKVL